MESEQAQALRLAGVATYPGLKSALQAYAASLPPSPNSVEPTPMEVIPDESAPKIVPAASVTTVQPVSVGAAAIHPAGIKFVPVENFSWDQGGYNSQTVI